MEAPRARETMSKQILQRIDSGDRSLMVIKDTPSAAPLSFSGNVPFWATDLYKIATPDESDPAGDQLHLATLEQMTVWLSKRRAPMAYTMRRVDADEIIFVHRGAATILTEVGEIDAPTGRFVFISRGVSYRVEPKGDNYMAISLVSEAPVDASKQCDVANLPFVFPKIAARAKVAGGQWEERIVTRSWTANAIRNFDPLDTKKVVGDPKKLVFGIDVDAVPASSPTAPMPGIPFGLFESPVLQWDISKRTDPLPFYHRNNRRNEVEFVHLGGGDQDTDLGYLSAPPGTFYNLPKGIEHSPMNRKAPLVCLIWETDGDVEVNPAILAR